MRVGLLGIAVAIGTANLFGRGLVDQALDVPMAIHASKHAAVDGMLELLPVNEQTDFVTVDLVRQRGVGMASKTVVIRGFMFGASDAGPKEQEYANCPGENSCCSVHIHKQMLQTGETSVTLVTVRGSSRLLIS